MRKTEFTPERRNVSRITYLWILVVVAIIVAAITTIVYKAHVYNAYALETENAVENETEQGDPLTFENLYAENLLTDSQSALWTDILSAYDAGVRGKWVCDVVIGEDELEQMRRPELLRSMERIRYADSLEYVITQGVEEECGIRPIVDMDALGEQFTVSTENEAALKAFLESCITSGMTQQEALRSIHDAMIKSCSYDETLTKDGMSDFFKGSCVCAGYARVFQAACLNIGIPCRYITGTAMGEYHAWNSVTVGGEELYVDVTWDCSNCTDEFFLSEEQVFSGTHREAAE